MDSLKVQRTLVTYGILIPVVLFMGYFIGGPTGARGYTLLALLFAVMSIPLLFNYHHILLVATWNAAFILGFISTSLYVWHAIAVVSFGLTILDRIVHRRTVITYKPLTYALLFFLLVVIGTSLCRGGIGVKALGSASYGGKALFYIALASIGFFAISWIKTPKHLALAYVALFFLASLTQFLGNILYMLGEKYWFLFLFIPQNYAVAQASYELLNTGIQRISGIGFAVMGIYYFIMARWGIRGIFDLSKPWRLLLFLLILIITPFGGFRSSIVIIFLLFLVQFFVEGLYRTKYVWILLTAAVLSLSIVYPAAQKLPTSFQRSLSFLPGIKIDPVAAADASDSIEWRLRMWTYLRPQIGDYFFLGKGFVYDAAEQNLAEESMRRGYMQSEEYSMMVGDYHNGPLSLLIPLGIWGAVGFLLMNIFGIRMLYLQLRYGDPDLYKLNVALLSIFIVRVIFFWGFYGAVSEIATFLGVLALSLTLNGQPRTTPWIAENEELELETVDTEN